MHLVSWKRALGIDLISCRSQYHTVLYLSSVDSPSNGGVCWVFIVKSLWFFYFPLWPVRHLKIRNGEHVHYVGLLVAYTWNWDVRRAGERVWYVSWFVGFFPQLKREFEVIALRSGTKSGAVWSLYVVVATIFDACILVTLRSLFTVICRLGQQIWKRYSGKVLRGPLNIALGDLTETFV